MKCFIIHQWDSNTRFVKAGPAFLDKAQAFAYIDKQDDPFAYSFTEIDLIK
ncbi:hypothetical protein LCGC14_0380700 [marine sediment metagenome]|uniref:Uncharacterized protein n=1 Tax=marine sediment metagenome TaxID=412755 RepID=A0A0F9T8F0_9ZZZZ